VIERPFAIIENVVTGLEHRRQGIGKSLLQHVIDFARDQDATNDAADRLEQSWPL